MMIIDALTYVLLAAALATTLVIIHFAKE